MLAVIKQPQKFANFSHLLVNRNQKALNVFKPCVFFKGYSSQVKLYSCAPNRDLLLSNAQFRTIISRQKSKRRKENLESRKRDIKEDDSDDDEDEENVEEEYIEDGALVKTYNLNSLRIDLILKQVLKQKRKKIEEFFYNNKIRVNGKILLKKAGNANVGDEIDLIKGISKHNSELIEVSRVEILDIEDNTDNLRYLLKIKKYKNLEVENYPEGDKWKEPEVDL